MPVRSDGDGEDGAFGVAAFCDPSSVHTIGELLVIGGEQLTFARLCDE